MTDGMGFEEALRHLKAGIYVRRKGWNGKDAFLYLATLRLIGEDGEDIVQLEPCIVMRTQQGKHQPGWLASQADMLAYDWERVPVEVFSEARILE